MEDAVMSSRVFQGVIVQMKEATNREIGVVDSEGLVVASSDLSLMGSCIPGINKVIEQAAEKVVVAEGRTFRTLESTEAGFEYAVFIKGTDELAGSLAIMAGVGVSEAKTYYKEKFNKAALVKNIITDNILMGDVYVKAKELHFPADAPRAVFLVRQVDRADIAVIDILQHLFPDRQKEFVLSITETDIAVIKELPQIVEAKEINKTAALIEQTLTKELDIKTVIGVGTIAKHLRELANRYKEAQVAIDVGKVFDTEKTIINYENLGIGRLIYQLPTTMCEMFLSEVFKKSPIDSLDDETLSIITKFFENNLNISETSRKLFVHRNTLVYRLGKIKKMTGLDLREFDQAIVFKVALMVKKYLDTQK